MKTRIRFYVVVGLFPTDLMHAH